MDPTTPHRAEPITARDAAVALLYLGGVLVLGLLPQDGRGLFGGTSDAGWTAVLAIGALAVAWRHRAPALVLGVTGGAALLGLVLAGHLGGYLLLFEALWAPVTFGRGRIPRLTTALGLVLAAVLGVLGVLGGGLEGLVLGLLIVLALIVTPLAWGWEVRHHREARAAAEALARAEAQLATERAERAVEREGRRIAQDLHDVLAGHLSAVALHTSLATALEDPAARETSLLTAREAATAALRDLRSVIDVLTGQEAAGAAPTATLSMRRLAARLDLGPGTSSGIVDERIEDPEHLDAAVRSALLRITAEAVTDALTHGAPPFRLDVSLTGGDVLLTCANALPDPAGSGAAGGPAQRGAGLGIRAMRDRAAAVGGSLTAGPVGDQWEVRARLPRGPVPALATGRPGPGDAA